MEVFVIDNASKDGNRNIIAESFPSVTVICNEKPEGFGANHNKVLRRGAGRYFLVLNDDTIILGEAIQNLVAFADANHRAAIVGPRVLNSDMTLQDSCVHFPSLWREIRAAIFHRFSRYPIDAYPPQAHDVIGDIDWLRALAFWCEGKLSPKWACSMNGFFSFMKRPTGVIACDSEAGRLVLSGREHYSFGEADDQQGRWIGDGGTIDIEWTSLFRQKSQCGRYNGTTCFSLYSLRFATGQSFTHRKVRTEQRGMNSQMLRYGLWLITRSPSRLLELVDCLGGVAVDEGEPSNIDRLSISSAERSSAR